MSGNHKKILDEYLKIASDEYFKGIEEENDKLMEEYKDTYYPKSLDTWFYDLMDQKEKKSKHKKQIKTLFSFARKSAAVFVGVLLIGLVVTLTVDAIRIEFLNLFVEKTNQYNEYSLSSDDLQKYVEQDGLYYYPRYIPEGYKLNEYNHDEFETNIEFINVRIILKNTLPSRSGIHGDMVPLFL